MKQAGNEEPRDEWGSLSQLGSESGSLLLSLCLSLSLLPCCTFQITFFIDLPMTRIVCYFYCTCTCIPALSPPSSLSSRSFSFFPLSPLPSFSHPSFHVRVNLMCCCSCCCCCCSSCCSLTLVLPVPRAPSYSPSLPLSTPSAFLCVPQALCRHFARAL